MQDRTPVGALRELHQQCRADYDSNAARRAQNHRDDAHLIAGTTEVRCPAAHPNDPTPCDGPVVVTVLDATNVGANGCEHHSARLLASLEGGRVYALPDAPDGAAIRVFKAADGLRPFCWYEDAPCTRPEQLSHAENRAEGEGR
ncbi:MULTISPECIES: hypothetical protein [unclassified Streptomyces]|uniref:hypothetical protein n=1 Tax=unclassified Streptomyces TaxID=2593676 RepID=UPI003D8FEFE1